MKNERKKELIAAYKEQPAQGGVCSIRNRETGQVFLFSCLNPKGRENRFRFSVSTNTCVENVLLKDWNAFGPAVFAFETLDLLEQKPDQTDAAFQEDLALLAEEWQARLAAGGASFY